MDTETRVYENPIEQVILLPIQFFPSPTGPLSAEKRLMLAVLEDGLKQFHDNKSKRVDSRRARRLFREMELWLRSSDISWIYSFENICATLGLDADAVREALFRENSLSTKPTHRLVRGGHTQVTEERPPRRC